MIVDLQWQDSRDYPDSVSFLVLGGQLNIAIARHVSGFGELSWWFSSDYLWLPGRTDYHTKDECLRKCRAEVMEKLGMEEYKDATP